MSGNKINKGCADWYTLYSFLIRKGQDETGTLTIGKVEYKVASEPPGDVATEGKADASSCLIFIELNKLLEDVFGFLCWDATAIILYGNHN